MPPCFTPHVNMSPLNVSVDIWARHFHIVHYNILRALLIFEATDTRAWGCVHGSLRHLKPVCATGPSVRTGKVNMHTACSSVAWNCPCPASLAGDSLVVHIHTCCPGAGGWGVPHQACQDHQLHDTTVTPSVQSNVKGCGLWTDSTS